MSLLLVTNGLDVGSSVNVKLNEAIMSAEAPLGQAKG